MDRCQGVKCAALVRCLILVPECTDISIDRTLGAREDSTTEEVSVPLQRPLYLVLITSVPSFTLLSNASGLHRIVEHWLRSNRSTTSMYLSAGRSRKGHGSFE